MTPDQAILSLDPSNHEWHNGSILALGFGSTARPSDWRVRYMGSGLQQVGFRLEGVSTYDSGLWQLRIRHGKTIVSTSFEIKVDPTTTTSTTTTTSASASTSASTSTTSTMPASPADCL